MRKKTKTQKIVHPTPRYPDTSRRTTWENAGKTRLQYPNCQRGNRAKKRQFKRTQLVKCTDEKWKLKKILSCRFEGKKAKDQATNLPWMN